MRLRPFVFIFLFLLPLISFAQDSIRFRDISLDEGLKIAQEKKKLVFFMGYASWCEHCKRMKEIIFKDKEVADYYNEHFICLKQDMEKGEGIKFHTEFQVKSYPTFVFLDNDGTTLYQSTGEKNDAMMIDIGKNALTPTMQFPYLKKEFEKDIANAEKCFTYVFALRSALLDCSEAAKKHLETQSDAQLLTAVNWKIIANGIMDIDSREFQFVLSHQKEYAALTSPARVERKIVSVAYELLTPYVNAKDSSGYFSKRSLAESIHHPKVDSLLFKYDLAIYNRLENWIEYKKIADKSSDTYAWNDASLLRDIANNYLLHISDSISLVNAVKWAKRAIDLRQENTLYILSAKLYKKAGDKQSAIEMAQKAKDMDIKDGWGHAAADSLINELQR